MFSREIATGREMFYQVIMGQLTCLGQAIHSLCDFAVDGVVSGFGLEIVVFYYVRWEEIEWHCDIFWFSQCCTQIEVLDVDGVELYIRGGEDAIDEKFDQRY